jgi:Xaa-Pro aminopeptidase
VTRTWPVSGRFSPRQRAAYEAVLAAERRGIEMCVPGTRYRDIHLEAARVLTRWMVDEKLFSGEVDGLVERGAHALFFPHGVGHLIGLDVHDLELYGDRAGYGPGRTRSHQFGLNALRLDRDLAAGNVVTIEPGFYAVPEILQSPEITAPFADVLDRDRAEAWLGFGGIRIEDDVHVTDQGPEVLTSAIPVTVREVEAAIAADYSPFE